MTAPIRLEHLDIAYGDRGETIIVNDAGAFDPDALTNSVVAWKYYIPEARAAIAAVREPTDEIRRTGDEMLSQHEAYQAVIDAALNENAE